MACDRRPHGCPVAVGSIKPNGQTNRGPTRVMLNNTVMVYVMAFKSVKNGSFGPVILQPACITRIEMLSMRRLMAVRLLPSLAVERGSSVIPSICPSVHLLFLCVPVYRSVCTSVCS